jgi:peroxiredoxin
MSEVRSTFTLTPGSRAPEFELPDAHGERHELAGLAGPQGLLLVFACNHCPFVIHLAGEVGALAAAAKQRGIGTVAINSNDLERFPADAPEKMLEFAARFGWEFPYLVDASQDVAKAYAAACTPDFYLFDGGLRLFYAGQFDASRPGTGLADGADLAGAIERMLAGGEPPVGARPSSGCNIKWKPGNEPTWFG